MFFNHFGHCFRHFLPFFPTCAGTFLPLFSTFFWPFFLTTLAIVVTIRPLLTASCCFWLLLAALDCLWLILVTFCHFKSPFLAFVAFFFGSLWASCQTHRSCLAVPVGGCLPGGLGDWGFGAPSSLPSPCPWLQTCRWPPSHGR